ncbi:MAG: alkylphosphonate utilization protein [Chitinophagaceae bacterium]|nr:MAG: alkylphosphonate utilization protein [Chitinophagaceae bacterium]
MTSFLSVCGSSYTYEQESFLLCPECGHEWNSAEKPAGNEEFVVKDSNGNTLQDGDTVVIFRNLPVRGTSQTIKAGTKVQRTGNWRYLTATLSLFCQIMKPTFVRRTAGRKRRSRNVSGSISPSGVLTCCSRSGTAPGTAASN